jgi:hypothetical protein
MEYLKKAPAPVSENIINNALELSEFLYAPNVLFKPVIQAEPNEIDLPLSIYDSLPEY